MFLTSFNKHALVSHLFDRSVSRQDGTYATSLHLFGYDP